MTEINVSLPDRSKKINQWDWPLNKDDGKVKVVNTKENCSLPARPKDGSDIKREIGRSYNLPSDVDIQTLKSKLTSKGHLVITADKKK
uniref:SHSP domain-containing protein n=1 Tax=Loa loa TaxID=7209 RepID=A0A1I7VJP5_LOALO